MINGCVVRLSTRAAVFIFFRSKGQACQQANRYTGIQSVKSLQRDKVPASQKICYGFGGLSDFIQNTIQALAIPIFAVGMGLDPLILGFVLALTKIVSAVADPLVGVLSDRTQSRWGRRKPFLILSAVVAAVLLPFVFRVRDGGENVQFGYIAAVLSFYFLTHSFFAVPYMALGFELTDDYDERTNIFAWKSYIGMAGIFAVFGRTGSPCGRYSAMK